MLAGSGLVVLPGVIGSSSGILVLFDGSSLVVLLSYLCEWRYSLLILPVPVLDHLYCSSSFCELADKIVRNIKHKKCP